MRNRCCGLVRDTHFCPDCGTRLINEIEQPGKSLLANLRIRLRSFDQATRGKSVLGEKNNWSGDHLKRDLEKREMKRELYLAWIGYIEKAINKIGSQ